MNQHLDKMTLKLVKVAVLVVSAIDLASGGNCNSSRNSDVLERAFGQVINSKLENQTMIMLEEMQGQDTFLQVLSEKLLNNQDIIIRNQKEACKKEVDAKLQEQSEYFEKKFNEQNETHKRNLDELKSISEGDFEELLAAKLQEQSDYFQETFKEQNETYKELLEQSDYFEDLKELNETYNQNLEEFESLQERYKTALKEVVHLAIQQIQQNTESEWVRIMNSDIWLSSESANFDEATEICDSMDARLYEPQSLLHNQLVYSLIEAKGAANQHHFLGINQQ